MSLCEEVLPQGHDLYNHLVDEGYIDFETFSPNQNKDLFQCLEHCSSLKSAECLEKIAPCTKLFSISCHDHEKVMAILNSKLLFVDDVELVELILMNAPLDSNGSRSNCYLQYGVVVASLVSTVMFHRQQMGLHFPVSAAVLCSLYSVWQWSKSIRERKENNILTYHITLLQKLCTNIHKMLRLLKETEILSTGQVSSLNIGAAMYMIPEKPINQLVQLPSWKTLPHLRKCLAYALVDAIHVFFCACDSLKQICPSWLSIKGYMSSNKPSLQEALKNIENMVCLERCITFKDLQLLNDIYLVLQSEYLRWIAFCICLSGPQNCDESKKCKLEVFKLVDVTQKSLLDIYLKLEMQYNIQNIFSRAKKVSVGLPLENKLKELNKIQVDVHGISLEMLSIILKIKNLEDYLEKCTLSNDEDCSIPSVKDHIAQQLSIVRDDLALAINGFDCTFNQLIMKKKPDVSLVECLNNVKKSETKLTLPSVDEPSLTVNSADEVFLAVSGFNDEPQSLEDDWCLGDLKIPETLLSELSETLKPIKRDFKERERLALKRLGLEDIQVELGSYSGEESEVDCPNQRREPSKSSKVKGSQYIPLRSNSESSEDCEQCMEDPNLILETEAAETGHTLSNLKLAPNMYSKLNDQTKASDNDSPTDSTQILSSSSLAKIIAMKSQSWGNTTEDCYSDD